MAAGAFNGSGVFALGYNFVTEAASAPIEISKLKDEFDGIATGLSTCIARDGQSTVSQNIPFNDKKITGLGNATADADALNRITADGRYIIATTKVKTATETVNNSTTFQDDDHLANFAIAAGKTYEIYGVLRGYNTATSGMKLIFVCDQTPQFTSVTSLLNYDGTTTPKTYTIQTIGSQIVIATSSSTELDLIQLHGVIKGHASAAGTLKLQWAQFAGTSQDTQLLIGSFLRLTLLD